MKEIIQKIVEKALLELKDRENWEDFEMPKIEVAYAKDEKFGDYSTNIAMILAGKFRKAPMEIAENIKDEISKIQNADLEKVEVVSPGYINFTLANGYFGELLKKINKEKEKFGSSQAGNGTKINNEFISANPTGPLHLGNGRGGFYGDSLGKVLRKCGHEVINEYYINDAGEQILKLWQSVCVNSSEDAIYRGDYIKDLNRKYSNDVNINLDSFDKSAWKIAEDVLENIIRKTTTEKMKIGFDSWISEKKDLMEVGYVERSIELLKNKKLTFEQDGALWLRTTDFRDDKDRVLVKSDGQKTYFASDCGYILSKKERGFDSLIEIWGADHHGYINRFRAAGEALGFQKEQIRFIVVQLVKLVKDGKEVRMSKRAGNVIYIDDLIEKVGHDVARFIFLMYSPDTHMNFDLGLAEEKSQKNPVFYVQYAHARMANILVKAGEVENLGNLNLLKHEKELSLMRELAKFPELVEEISQSYEVHKLPYYAIRLADKFHSFYNACQVIDPENPELSSARLELVKSVKIVLGETLRLIGVSAPERM